MNKLGMVPFLDKIGLLSILRSSRLYRLKNRKNYQEFNKQAPEILERVCELFQREAIAAWPAFGTLLGLIREAGLIKNDLDLDFGVVYDERVQSKIQTLLVSHEFTLVCSVRDQHGTIFLEKYMHSGVPLDIYYFFAKNDKLCSYDLEQDGSLTVLERVHSGDSVYAYRSEFTSFTLQKKRVANLTVNLPSSVHDHLSECYGANYTRPDPGWHNNKRAVRYRDPSISPRVKEY